MVDHCQSFALSDPDNGLFQKKCNHDQVEICSECYKLNKVLADIEIACSKLLSEEEREDTMCMFQQAKDDVMAWKAHQLRSVNQDQAKFEKVYCKQDNAGCYYCGSTIVGSTSASGV